MNIHLLNNDDWPTFKTFRLAALSEHPEAFSSSFEEESKMSDELFRRGFDNCDVFGAFKGDELIGCGGFFALSKIKTSHRGVLFSMYCNLQNRKKGVADSLVKAIIAHAKSRVIQLHVTVVTINQAALRLYEKNGFKIYGTEPRSLKVGNQFYDEHMLVLSFKEYE